MACGKGEPAWPHGRARVAEPDSVAGARVGGYRVASGVTTWQLELPGGATYRPGSGTAKKEV